MDKEKIEAFSNKFGIVIWDYITQERLKRLGYNTGIEDFIILSHWSRSVVGNDYDLEHPDYLEYKKHYKVGDVSWLEKDKTFVDMKKYKLGGK